MTFTARLAGVVMTLVLSGTPTLLQACAALCTPEMRHTHTSAVVEPATSTVDVAHRHHAGHTMDAATSPAPKAATAATSESALRLGSVDPSCCPDAPAIAATTLTATRLDAPVLLAPAVTAARWDRLPRATASVVISRRTTLRPSSARPPLVLRI